MRGTRSQGLFGVRRHSGGEGGPICGTHVLMEEARFPSRRYLLHRGQPIHWKSRSLVLLLLH